MWSEMGKHYNPSRWGLLPMNIEEYQFLAHENHQLTQIPETILFSMGPCWWWWCWCWLVMMIVTMMVLIMIWRMMIDDDDDDVVGNNDDDDDDLGSDSGAAAAATGGGDDDDDFGNQLLMTMMMMMMILIVFAFFHSLLIRLVLDAMPSPSITYFFLSHSCTSDFLLTQARQFSKNHQRSM